MLPYVPTLERQYSGVLGGVAPAAAPDPDAKHEAEVEDEVAREGDWIVLAERGKPWFGVVTEVMRDDQVRVHQYAFVPGSKLRYALPKWMKAGDPHKLRTAATRPKPEATWEPLCYIASMQACLACFPRDAQDPHTAPVALLKRIADYNRDPG